MTISKTFIGIIAIAMVFTGLMVILGGFQSNYNFDINSNYTGVYGNLNETIYGQNSTIEDLKNNLQEAANSTTSGIPILGWVDNFFNLGISAVKSSLGTINIFSSMTSALVTFIPGLA